ncbi:hypothetical protein HMPREF3190_00564 [Umbribacter vaginalis]|nr:hypothetical protein HMPREF3190_00564 [Coriobacteriales bacterium DNF00809]
MKPQLLPLACNIRPCTTLFLSLCNIHPCTTLFFSHATLLHPCN